MKETLGCTNLDQFFQRAMPAGARSKTWIAESRTTAFAGSPEPFISIINSASVSEIIRDAQKTFDPRQFRANLLIASAERWEEHDWIGRTIEIAGGKLRIETPIE